MPPFPPLLLPPRQRAEWLCDTAGTGPEPQRPGAPRAPALVCGTAVCLLPPGETVVSELRLQQTTVWALVRGRLALAHL